MARENWSGRNVGGERDERGRYGYARRKWKTIEWLVLGTVFCAAVAGFNVERRGSAAQAFLAEAGQLDGRLTTTVVTMQELERDSLGRFTFEGFGGRLPRLVPVAVRGDLSLLREHRDRARDRRQLDLRRKPFPDLPLADDAPPRMDSGHPDPDRLLPSSRPVTENVR